MAYALDRRDVNIGLYEFDYPEIRSRVELCEKEEYGTHILSKPIFKNPLNIVLEGILLHLKKGDIVRFCVKEIRDETRWSPRDREYKTLKEWNILNFTTPNNMIYLPDISKKHIGKIFYFC